MAKKSKSNTNSKKNMKQDCDGGVCPIKKKKTTPKASNSSCKKSPCSKKCNKPCSQETSVPEVSQESGFWYNIKKLFFPPKA